MSDSLWPHWLSSTWNSPGQNTGVGSLSLLQWIFPTLESNRVSCIAGRFFISWATREALRERISGGIHNVIYVCMGMCVCVPVFERWERLPFRKSDHGRSPQSEEQNKKGWEGDSGTESMGKSSPDRRDHTCSRLYLEMNLKGLRNTEEASVAGLQGVRHQGGWQELLCSARNS